MQETSLHAFFDGMHAFGRSSGDAEPVHRSGAVQAGYVFLEFAPQSGALVAWSINASDLGLAIPSARPDQPINISGLTYGNLLPEIADELLDIVADPVNCHQHIGLSKSVDRGGSTFDAIATLQLDRLFVELMPQQTLTLRDMRVKLRVTKKACASILAAPDFDMAMQIATEAIQDLTGYDRVKVYQLLADGSGGVRAESAKAGVPSFLGLRFPATDIPKQTRDLMRAAPYRCVRNVHDDVSPIRGDKGLVLDSLDLTWSLGRAVSTMHTQSLRDLGVACAFSATLKDGTDFWGMIVCHSNERIDVSADVWSMAKDVADALMVKLGQVQHEDRTSKVKEMRDLEAKVAAQLGQHRSVEDVLSHHAPSLQQFLDASGFAFQFDGNVYTVGQAPPPAFTRRLIDWVGKTHTDRDNFRSSALHRQWPEAREHMSTACGVLMQQVIIHRVCQLVWYRGAIAQTVHWADPPDTFGKETDEKDRPLLNPGNAYERWVTEHSEEAAEWTESEISAARDLFRGMLDVIASQAQKLKRMNAELQLTQEETREELAQFAYAAVHDIQNPINTITNALKLMQEQQGEDVDPMTRKSMEFAFRSSDRLRNLSNQMADFVALGRKDIEPVLVPLDEVITDVLGMLDQLIAETRASFDVPPLPFVAGNRDLLTILFHNLLSNALKYRREDRAPHVRVEAAKRHHVVHVAVADNGQGIPPDQAAKAFKPFSRLHRNDEVKGSGLGLATCKRIADLHKTAIHIDPEHTEGTRFLFAFMSKPWMPTI